MSRRIYLASSWRNDGQPALLKLLRDQGHDVYDFRNPPDGSSGFAWSEIDPHWLTWTPDQFRAALENPIAVESYLRDLAGMRWADTFVCLLPCGKSAHLEAGWASGRGVPTLFVYPPGQEPELMAKLGGGIATSSREVLRWLRDLPPVFDHRPDWPTWFSHLRTLEVLQRIGDLRWIGSRAHGTTVATLDVDGGSYTLQFHGHPLDELVELRIVQSAVKTVEGLPYGFEADQLRAELRELEGRSR